MKITVLNACENVKNYIEQVENGISAEAAWEKEAIEPFWDRLCCYSPTDLSERKPKPIRDLQGLKEQCERLSELNLALLETEFQRISSTLPNYDDSPLLVVIFPCDTNDTTVNEKQNGVVGTSLFGNILIQVNSLIEGYEAWIKYVFAHEYHHTIWGNYWFVLHAGTLSDEFINSLVIDGEADCFALELYPDLKPKWIFDMPIAEVQRLWEENYKEIATKSNVAYETYMFGNEKAGIPWCAGYAIGFHLVHNYLAACQKSVVEILEMKPERILATATIDFH